MVFFLFFSMQFFLVCEKKKKGKGYFRQFSHPKKTEKKKGKEKARSSEKNRRKQ